MSIRDANLTAYANEFVEYTELRVQENRNRTIGLLNGDVVTNSESANRGASARVFKDGMWGFSSRAGDDDAAIRDGIAEARRNAAFLAARSPRPETSLPGGTGSHSVDFGTAKERRSTAAAIEFLKTLDAHIEGSYPSLKSRHVRLIDLDMEKRLFTSDGADAYSNITRSLIYVRLVAENDRGEPVELAQPFGSRGQFEDVFEKPDDFFPAIAELHGHLVAKCDAVPAIGGEHDVVFDSEMAGILAHEAIGHTTEADIVRAGSVAGDQVDDVVASPLITMVDFAHSYEGETLLVPVFVDDEGVAGQDRVLIDKGVLKGFMHTKESAAEYGVPPTGNARAYEFSDEPLIRMRNTAILPGTDKLEDMIASIEDGYYLMWPSNGQADSTSEFMFGVRLGYEIKNGELGRAITDTTISGVAFDMLKTVTMVSDEMSWSCAGMCGKKQPIPVSFGGPSIKCRVHVGGQ